MTLFKHSPRAYIWYFVCIFRIMNEHKRSIYRAPVFTETQQQMLTNLYKPRVHIRDFTLYAGLSVVGFYLRLSMTGVS